MLDNNDIAILTRLNTLAERYGLKPTDFVATVRSGGELDDPETILRFEAPASGNKLRVERFDKMLDALGIARSDTDPKVTGDAGKVYDALGAAIDRAPKPRGRL